MAACTAGGRRRQSSCTMVTAHGALLAAPPPHTYRALPSAEVFVSKPQKSYVCAFKDKMPGSAAFTAIESRRELFICHASAQSAHGRTYALVTSHSDNVDISSHTFMSLMISRRHRMRSHLFITMSSSATDSAKVILECHGRPTSRPPRPPSPRTAQAARRPMPIFE